MRADTSTDPGREVQAADPDARPPSISRRGLWLLLAVAALHALPHGLLLPPWMGEDEPWQLEMAHHVSTGHWPGGGRVYVEADLERLPLSHVEILRRFPSLAPEEVAEWQRSTLASMEEHAFRAQVDWAPRGASPATFDEIANGFSASNHPPLHFLLTGAWIRALGTNGPLAELRAARLLSFALYLAAVLFGALFARELVSDPAAAWCAALAGAWIPIGARAAWVMNNDALARALAAAVLWLAARALVRSPSRSSPLSNGARRPGDSLSGSTGEWRELLLALGLAALALLAKTTAASALAAVAAALLLRARGGTRAWVRLAVLGLVLALGLAAAAAWAGHSSPALPKSLAALGKRVGEAVSAGALSRFGRATVGTFGWEARGFSPGTYGLFAVAGALVGAGALVALARPPPGFARRALVLCWLILLAQLALVVLRGVGVGRYLLPALPAAAVLMAAGSEALAPRAARGAALVLLLVGLLAWNAVFVWAGLLPYHHWIAGS